MTDKGLLNDLKIHINEVGLPLYLEGIIDYLDKKLQILNYLKSKFSVNINGEWELIINEKDVNPSSNEYKLLVWLFNIGIDYDNEIKED